MCFYFVFQKKIRKPTSILKTINCSSSGKTVSSESLLCLLEDVGNTTKNDRKIILEAEVKIPIFKAMVNLEIQHRPTPQSEYRTFINNTLEACSFLNGTDKNPIGKFMLDQVSETLPKELIHPCPYFGSFKFNFTLKGSSSIKFLAKGDLELKYYVYDAKDSNIFTLNLLGSFL